MCRLLTAQARGFGYFNPAAQAQRSRTRYPDRWVFCSCAARTPSLSILDKTEDADD